MAETSDPVNLMTRRKAALEHLELAAKKTAVKYATGKLRGKVIKVQKLAAWFYFWKESLYLPKDHNTHWRPEGAFAFSGTALGYFMDRKIIYNGQTDERIKELMSKTDEKILEEYNAKELPANFVKLYILAQYLLQNEPQKPKWDSAFISDICTAFCQKLDQYCLEIVDKQFRECVSDYVEKGYMIRAGAGAGAQVEADFEAMERTRSYWWDDVRTTSNGYRIQKLNASPPTQNAQGYEYYAYFAKVNHITMTTELQQSKVDKKHLWLPSQIVVEKENTVFYLCFEPLSRHMMTVADGCRAAKELVQKEHGEKAGGTASLLFKISCIMVGWKPGVLALKENNWCWRVSFALYGWIFPKFPYVAFSEFSWVGNIVNSNADQHRVLLDSDGSASNDAFLRRDISELYQLLLDFSKDHVNEFTKQKLEELNSVLASIEAGFTTEFSHILSQIARLVSPRAFDLQTLRRVIPADLVPMEEDQFDYEGIYKYFAQRIFRKNAM